MNLIQIKNNSIINPDFLKISIEDHIESLKTVQDWIVELDSEALKRLKEMETFLNLDIANNNTYYSDGITESMEEIQDSIIKLEKHIQKVYYTLISIMNMQKDKGETNDDERNI